MDANRIDRLTAQYVWAIQSDADWYRSAERALKANCFGTFRRHTGNAINRIQIMEGKKLKGIEWAFVVLELWVQGGGDPYAALSDPGTLAREYEELISDNVKVPKQEFIRRKGDLFGTYGDVYTFRDHAIERQSKTYTEAEMTFLRTSYEVGYDFKDIAIAMHRPALGVCEKMRLMGLLETNDNGDFVCAKDVPKPQPENTVSNPCGEIALNELQRQITEHIEYANAIFETIPFKEKPMSITTNPNVAIETKVIVFGQDATTLSEQQLIDAIKRIEGDIAKLKEVKTKSKKIASNIAELESSLAKIVEILDAR